MRNTQQIELGVHGERKSKMFSQVFLLLEQEMCPVRILLSSSPRPSWDWVMAVLLLLLLISTLISSKRAHANTIPLASCSTIGFPKNRSIATPTSMSVMPWIPSFTLSKSSAVLMLLRMTTSPTPPSSSLLPISL